MSWGNYHAVETCSCGAVFATEAVIPSMNESALRGFRDAHASCRPVVQEPEPEAHGDT